MSNKIHDVILRGVLGVTMLVAAAFALVNNNTSAAPQVTKNAKVVEVVPSVKEVDSVSLTENNTQITPTKKHISRKVLPPERTLLLLDEVTQNSVDFLISKINDLSNESTSPIYLLIDSPGGSVFDGAMLISAMESSRAPVYTICVRLCASMAFGIHQHGKMRYMLDRAVLMSHDASGGVQGDVSRMKSLVGFISNYIDKDNAYVAKRAHMSLVDYKNEIMRDMWIDAQDATSRHFSDGLVSLNKSNFKVDFPTYQEYQKFLKVSKTSSSESEKAESSDNYNFRWITPRLQ